MDLILICGDALQDAVIGNVGVAMEAKKAGQDVGILFTREALAGLAGEAFQWSFLFQSREAGAKISRNATAMGIEVADTRDSRWTNLKRLLTAAKGAGITLMACPIWSQILAVDGKLPPEIATIDTATMLKELQQAKIIIGGF